MKRLLNTLYIATDGAYLYKEGETVAIKIKEEVKKRFPIHNLEGIVCIGYISLSSSVMHFCSERNVTISLLNPQGKFLAKIQGPISGNVLLRRQQYRIADDAALSGCIASRIVLGKVFNSRAILMRSNRDRNEPHAAITNVINYLDRQLGQIKQTEDLDVLRGFEGDAAKEYFSVFDYMIVAQKEGFSFVSRTRRPPMDNVNALLSFIYTLLAHDVRSALETVGLDPQVGFLHRDRPGRPSLALDMMEELRSFLADRLVLTLINRRQVDAAGFIKTESGGVLMSEATRKEVIAAYQKRKQEEITHPFLQEKIHIGLIPHIQALLLARYLRGDLDSYPVFLYR